MDDLYTSEWRLFHNFFLLPVKLVSKKLVASKIIKCYDTPKTPYQRVLEADKVSPDIKQYLKEQFKDLNPFKPRKCIKKKLKNLRYLL